MIRSATLVFSTDQMQSKNDANTLRCQLTTFELARLGLIQSFISYIFKRIIVSVRRMILLTLGTVRFVSLSIRADHTYQPYPVYSIPVCFAIHKHTHTLFLVSTDEGIQIHHVMVRVNSKQDQYRTISLPKRLQSLFTACSSHPSNQLT